MTRLIPIALALLWGLNWPAVRLCLNEIPPFGLRMIGLTLGAAILFALAKFTGRSLAVRPDQRLRLITSGILNIAIFNVTTVFAQLNTTTSRAAILTFTTPLWSILLARMVLGERLDRPKAIALSIGMTGLALLAIPLVTGQKNIWGLILPLTAAFGWAAGTVFQKTHPVEGDRIAITAWQLLIGAAVALAGFVLTGEHLPVSLMPITWVALVFHVVGSTAIAYLLWFMLLDRLSVSAASLTTLSIPVVGVLSAMLLVGDRPSLADWVGFAAIIVAAATVLLGIGRRDTRA